jgi:hypothetical protein
LGCWKEAAFTRELGDAARQEQLIRMFDRAAKDVNAEDYAERGSACWTRLLIETE